MLPSTSRIILDESFEAFILFPFYLFSVYFQDYFEYFQFDPAAFSTIDTDFYNVLAFCSSGTLVWFRQDLPYCGRQYFFAAHQELPNRSAPTPFLGV